jgi:hypothetical protein
LDELAVTVDRTEVARLLGYATPQLPDRVQDLLAEAERQAPLLVRPAGLFVVLDREDYCHSPFLAATDRAALALVTIGDGVDRAVERYREQGLLAPALVFDAFGSAAAEAVAGTAEVAVRGAVEAGGVRCSRRFSPGYGGWDVSEQRWILEVLGGEDIGVSLTPGRMMEPRKSITFAMTVGPNPIELRSDDICAACGAPDCRWRDTPWACERTPPQ